MHCSRRTAFLLGLVFISATAASRADQPSPAATAAFNQLAASVEARLARQHKATSGFIAPPAGSVQQGQLAIERVAPPEVSGAMLHHWRGTAFVPGATAESFEKLMRDTANYPAYFAPQVLKTSTTPRGAGYQILMRVRQQHVLTVVLDTTCDVDFARLDAAHRFSASRSTRIEEIAVGQQSDYTLTPEQDHGFLWRLNTYWSWEERDGGLYMQIETISLTRAIPTGLGWIIGPFVQSVPRESLEFTLRSMRAALAKQKQGGAHE